MKEDISRTLLGLPAGLPGSRVAIAETFPRYLCTTGAPTSARWVAVATYLPAGLKISGLTAFSGATALSVGTHQWFGIWDKSTVPALLAGSADDTSTAWGTHTAKRLALTSPFTTTYAGRYYIGLEITATTVPTLACLPSAGGALRVLTPSDRIVDTTTADTALAPTLVQAANTSSSEPTPYFALD